MLGRYIVAGFLFLELLVLVSAPKTLRWRLLLSVIAAVDVGLLLGFVVGWSSYFGSALTRPATVTALAAAFAVPVRARTGWILLAAVSVTDFLADDTFLHMALVLVPSIVLAWAVWRISAHLKPAVMAGAPALLVSLNFTVLALAGPRLLVTSGRVWRASQVALLPALTLSAVILAAVFGLVGYARTHPKGSSSDQLASIAAAVAVVVAVTTLSEATSNAPLPVGAVAGCQGVQVHHVPFLAETPDTGANARSGPTDLSSQLQRLGESCSVGILGYCRGVPLYDLPVPVRDARWYVLPHHQGLISSTAVRDLSPLSNLRLLHCSGDTGPANVTGFTVRAVGPELTISVTSLAAANVGVSVYRPAFPPVTRFRQLLLDTKPLDGAQTTYGFQSDAAIVPGDADVIIAATACLAVDVPDGRALFDDIGLPLRGRKFAATRITLAPASPLAQGLLHAACRYQLGEGIPVVPAKPPA